MRSHSHPISSRATTVTDTDPMTSQPICDWVSAISSRTIFMSGAIPNQAKKQRKNANHVTWNARIGGEPMEKSRIRVALPVTSMIDAPPTRVRVKQMEATAGTADGRQPCASGARRLPACAEPAATATPPVSATAHCKRRARIGGRCRRRPCAFAIKEFSAVAGARGAGHPAAQRSTGTWRWSLGSTGLSAHLNGPADPRLPDAGEHSGRPDHIDKNVGRFPTDPQKRRRPRRSRAAPPAGRRASAAARGRRALAARIGPERRSRTRRTASWHETDADSGDAPRRRGGLVCGGPQAGTHLDL